MGGTLHLHRSNRTEVLAAQLGDLVEEPVGGPFEPEWVVAQSRGMAAWLEMRLAQRLGICANVEFPFPRRLVERAYDAVLPNVDAEAGTWSRERMQWAALAALPDLLGAPELARVRRFLGNDGGGVRRLQLARRVAAIFDQYLTFRPEMVRAWHDGSNETPGTADAAWQPLLWRAMTQRLGPERIAVHEPAFLKAAASASGPVPGLPRRLALFGLSTLPPLYLRVLAALAERIEVHLFSLSPSREHWSELVPARQAARLLLRAPSDAELHLSEQNDLLASMGTLGAEFTAALADVVEAAGLEEREQEAWVEPDAATLLGRLQRDLLHLRGPGAEPPAEPERPARRPRRAADHPTLPFAEPPPGRPRLRLADGSIAVHACHAPMREVEVLHDQLLGVLEDEPDLQPRDIVVMVADVDAYAPLIEAVFEREGGPILPYRIADRSVRSQSPVVEALQRLLTMAGGRVPASEVLDLLRLAPVHARFGIEPGDLETLTEWILAAGIRWGIDASHRERQQLPAEAANSWGFGLQRMLLGYAMATEGRVRFGDVLPFEHIEGHDAERLGRLAEFCAQLFGWLRRLEEPRRPVAWRDALGALLDGMISADGELAGEHQRVRAVLGTMVDEAAAAGFDGALDIVALRQLVEPMLDEAHAERGFPGGGVTFCAFVPMRAIPFEVVAMVGLNDGAFPRIDRPVDFDLLSAGPQRPGDRSRRTDDRYLFLEALLSARRRVLITYTGQSIRDNRPLPPSVAVAELLDWIVDTHDPAARSPDGDARAAVRDQVVIQHPLQPFSRRYFGTPAEDPRLFSFEAAYLGGATSLQGERQVPPPLFAAPLAEPEPSDELGLDELLQFLRSPAGYLLQRRLQVRIRELERDVEDLPPLEMDGLQEYALGDRFLDLCLQGVDPDEACALEQASGRLPPGPAGQQRHAELWRTVASIAERVRAEQHGTSVAPHTVARALPGGMTLTGTLEGLWRGGAVHAQFSRVKAKDLLVLWLRHLVLCWAAPSNVELRSVLVGRAPRRRPRSRGGAAPSGEIRVCTLEPVTDPGAELSGLAGLFAMGQRAPLHLLPATSRQYAKVAAADGPERALQAATDAWLRGWGEDHYDQHLSRVFGGSVPPFTDVVTCGPPFGDIAVALFGGLRAHLKERYV
ncbi:MAG: exodeoxyribonuclease V subunit gamma [Planctomycetota bacterium]